MQQEKSKKQKLEYPPISLPGGVSAELAEKMLLIKGPKGTVKREFKEPIIKIKVEGGAVKLSADRSTANEFKKIRTAASHIKNMIAGSQNGHKYLLKICSGHFPMNVSISGNELSIKNFLGEKYPRKMKIKEGVKVKVEGQEVIVEGITLEDVSQCAANIETLTKVRNRDRRIFQDGVYITTKDGKPVEE